MAIFDARALQRWPALSTAARGGAHRRPHAKVQSVNEEAAVAEIYQRYAPVIYARCFRYLGSSAAARDAVQETFVRVLARGLPLDGAEPLRFLHRVSTNLCLNILRERRVHERAGTVLARRATASSADEDGHADRQFASALLDRCSERDATIAVMHYIDRMTHSEIAEVLGISRRTVFNRLRRLQAMASELRDGARQGDVGQEGLRSREEKRK